MRAEYYPPKVDILIQNEISTDFYIIVSGAVVCQMPDSTMLSNISAT